MALEYDLVGAINDDYDIQIEEDSDSDVEKESVKKKNKKDFTKDFQFDVSDDEDANLFKEEDESTTLSSLDSKIEAKKLKLKKQSEAKSKNEKKNDGEDDEESDDEEDEEEMEDTNENDDRIKEKPRRMTKKSERMKNQQEEPDEQMSYGEVINADANQRIDEFSSMELSRPIMRAINLLGWGKPTPIQSATIPVALTGNDICACAATGTGKTGAFMIPTLERLVHKPDHSPITRVLILTPTRELAVQIYQVSKELAQFTKITISLAAGGLDRSSQEAALRLGPDIVVATLGRLIDHLQNAPNFNLNTIEILVLDEADRMIDEYFERQMREVIERCSILRQTMLFSATMTEKVKDLAFLSLKNPTKIFVNENQEVALNLQQEFVRIRPNHEMHREAIVAALVKRTFHQRTIVFIETKKLAHRLHIILGLLDINVAELHGNLSQPQRLEALENFKEARIDVLIATDLVGRGLDIDGIKTVINMNMPASLERYIHRVGRTARAGKSGRSITLVGDSERKLFEKAVKASKVPVKMRTIPADVIGKYRAKLKRLETEISEIEEEEEAEKEMRVAELKANKASKMIEHRKEIESRPKRTWFQSHKDRVAERDQLTNNVKKKRIEGDQNFK